MTVITLTHQIIVFNVYLSVKNVQMEMVVLYVYKA